MLFEAQLVDNFIRQKLKPEVGKSETRLYDRINIGKCQTYSHNKAVNIEYCSTVGNKQ